MSQLTRLPWLPVASMTLSSAPGNPLLGDTYVVPSNATGIWAANVGKLAEWTGSGWNYISPPDGHGIGLPDGRIFVRIAGVYTSLAATQSEVNSGQVNNRFVTPETLAKERPSYMSARSGSQSIPDDVWTTLSSYSAAPTNFRGASTFSGGVLTIGAGDEGLWIVTLSAAELGLGTFGQATRITLNNLPLCSDGGQTNNDLSYGRSASSAVVPLVVGDVVRFQLIQTTGSPRTFDEYTLSAARLGAA